MDAKIEIAVLWWFSVELTVRKELRCMLECVTEESIIWSIRVVGEARSIFLVLREPIMEGIADSLLSVSQKLNDYFDSPSARV
jgi:hypothetical protein